MPQGIGRTNLSPKKATIGRRRFGAGNPDADRTGNSDRASEAGTTGVGAVSLMDGGLDRPHGIALSPDERTLCAGSAAMT